MKRLPAGKSSLASCGFSEAKRSGEICGWVQPQTNLYFRNPSPLCHPDRSEAKWRDLQLGLTRKTDPSVWPPDAKRICHQPERSEVERSAVRFNPKPISTFVTLSPLSSRPKRSEVERSAVGPHEENRSFGLASGCQTNLSSRPERSEVERSAVRFNPKPISTFVTPLPFVISTEAKWRDLQLGLTRKTDPSVWPPDAKRICHLDRSEAKWRDLRFGSTPNQSLLS